MNTKLPKYRSPPFNLIWGFVAGFLATLIFHQIAVAVLWQAGLAPGAPYQMAPRPPFGVPAVFSLAFYGGLWGALFAAIDRYFPHDWRYWLTALIGGAIFPSLVALLVVVPIKGGAIGAGWNPKIWAFALIVNGIWGVGTGIILHGLRRVTSIRRPK